MYTGSVGFYHESWKFWNDRFDALRLDPELSIGAHHCAAQAWCKISLMETDAPREDKGRRKKHVPFNWPLSLGYWDRSPE